VGWVIVVGHTKRQFQTANLLEVNFNQNLKKKKHFTSCNISKCPYGSLDIKRETNLLIFFNVFWNLCILSKNKFECLRVISYK
jgi:hypothetical protein